VPSIAILYTRTFAGWAQVFLKNIKKIIFRNRPSKYWYYIKFGLISRQARLDLIGANIFVEK